MSLTALDAAMQALLQQTAAEAILPYYRKLTAQQIEAKLADDVVTVADKLSEELLGNGLRRIADLPVVGEEAAFADPTVFERLTGDCWIVDPLDGTRNFARGEPPFGILIARASAGVTESGWIYDVLTGRLCVAHRGQGAYVDGEQITAITTGESRPVAAVSLLFMDMAKRDGVLAGIGDHYHLVDVPWCAAEQYPRLALGTNDVSLFERTLPWDHAAGTLWLNEAGGKAARLDGAEYRVDDWQRPGLLGAATPELWDSMAQRLAAL